MIEIQIIIFIPHGTPTSSVGQKSVVLCTLLLRSVMVSQQLSHCEKATFCCHCEWANIKQVPDCWEGPWRVEHTAANPQPSGSWHMEKSWGRGVKRDQLLILPKLCYKFSFIFTWSYRLIRLSAIAEVALLSMSVQNRWESNYFLNNVKKI